VVDGSEGHPLMEGIMWTSRSASNWETQCSKRAGMRRSADLAGGIAQRFQKTCDDNQGYTELALESSKDFAGAAGGVERIEDASERASTLCGNCWRSAGAQVIAAKLLDEQHCDD